METMVKGIHHVTAITGEPQPNLDFYVGILGLRFVKKTVNFDVPDTYHFYYGDEVGRPGTILTFFSWPDAPSGRRGTGQVATTAFSIPIDSLAYWQERLTSSGLQVEGPITRFGEQVLAFQDPEGLGLELVAHAEASQRPGWQNGPVPAEHTIRGFHSVTLSVVRYAQTGTLLTDLLGFQQTAQEDKRTRFEVGNSKEGSIVDVLNLSGSARGIEAIGTVHHVAWRTANDEQQLTWRNKLLDAGTQVTPVMDRTYFHSIYFREPSGILFEIATDQPGFPVDEDIKELGTHLKLPPWLEERRAFIEQELPPVSIPTFEQNSR